MCTVVLHALMAVLISSHSAVGVPCVHCPTQGSCKVHTSEEEGVSMRHPSFWVPC